MALRVHLTNRVIGAVLRFDFFDSVAEKVCPLQDGLEAGIRENVWNPSRTLLWVSVRCLTH